MSFLPERPRNLLRQGVHFSSCTRNRYNPGVRLAECRGTAHYQTEDIPLTRTPRFVSYRAWAKGALRNWLRHTQVRPSFHKLSLCDAPYYDARDSDFHTGCRVCRRPIVTYNYSVVLRNHIDDL